MAITALYRDAAGVFLEGATAFVSALPASGSIPFSHGLRQVDNPAVIEIYAVPWSGAPDVWNELAGQAIAGRCGTPWDKERGQAVVRSAP